MSFEGFRIHFNVNGMSSEFSSCSGILAGSDIQDSAMIAFAEKATKEMRWRHDSNFFQCRLDDQKISRIVASRVYVSPGYNGKYVVQHIVNEHGKLEINAKPTGWDGEEVECDKEEGEDEEGGEEEDKTEDEVDESKHANKAEVGVHSLKI